MNDKFCDSHYNLGNVYQILHDYESALFEYDRAVEEGEAELSTVFRHSHMVPPPTVIKFCLYKAKMLYCLADYKEAQKTLSGLSRYRRIIDPYHSGHDLVQDGEEEEGNVRLTKFMVENRLGHYDRALGDAAWLPEHEDACLDYVSNWVIAGDPGPT